MKRFLRSFAFCFAFMLIFSGFSEAAGATMRVKTNGNNRKVSVANVKVNGFDLYSEYKPYVDNGRTFVPIRELTELMGANVKWNQKTKSVSISMMDKDVKLKINSSVVYVNGKKMRIDDASVPKLTQYTAQNNECKTMVPLRFLSESLGFSVDWDQNKRLAMIDNGVVKAPQQQNNAKPVQEPKAPVEKVKEPMPLPKEPEVNDAKPQPMEPGQKKNITVVIDPGHGGKDSGAIAEDKTTEKALNLRVAPRVESMLRERGYNVIMTRTTDEFIALSERAAIANRNNADIFVSIHFNSAGSASPYGIEVLYASENDVELKKDAGDQTLLAREVLNAVLKETGANSRGIKNRPELAVLRRTNMTACLIEGGFMSNPDELEKLKSDSYLDKLATGIVKGIENYNRKYM
ncbi:MAG: N-acetylmuramoyl-L-alanine amidase [Peptoniphilaceae bacterium]|uniref:N-acetylmuramoyl-L-alanine amidase n=1 Tax=Aedoeadaptatus acetigenes TaxID=2981723 RepID=UPI0011DD5C60|nr:N-acetylmuramoyl-L-alanine amidase [Aedoeadaptatus acetigenes]MBS6524577.1 N-acetylmuramoyl-L-alanine amidase [Peptoniphilaceae bacterium]MCU6786373.1 N-acetylmuramoyl-L-alanine amidase [Aedoeadaptatus acetigenes]